MKEKIIEITPEGLTDEVRLKFGIMSSITEEILLNSSFTMLEDNLCRQTLVSSILCSAGLVIFVWDECDDGIFRWKVDINITHEDEFRIEKKVEDGSSRRVSIKF